MERGAQFHLVKGMPWGLHPKIIPPGGVPIPSALPSQHLEWSILQVSKTFFLVPEAWEVCKGLSKHLPTTITFLQLSQGKVFYCKEKKIVVQEEEGQWLVHSGGRVAHLGGPCRSS